MKKESNKIYLSGERLYGDDFSLAQIKEWYEDEKEGYSGLISGEGHSYGYHELNKLHGFSKLRKIKKFRKVLGFGAAYGHELYPILDRIGEVHIIEPSKKLRSKSLKGKKVKYADPSISGKLPYGDDSFDLITCFGVLHHIPNVSTIMKEFSRVLN